MAYVHEVRRRIAQASEDRRCVGARCPACFIVRDATPKDFACRLGRCPRSFVLLKPPAGSLPAVQP
jgi:hypothetical protein